MTQAELLRRERTLPASRPTRRSMRAGKMGRKLVEALADPDFSHLDPELNKLMK